MMPMPDTLPLHLMLTMMQSASFPNAYGSLNAPWMQFLPDWMRPKSPLEQASDQMLNLWQNLGNQWGEASQQLIKNAFPQSPSGSDTSSSSRRMPGSHSSGGRSRDKPGMTDNTNPFTDMLPHFMQPEFLSALGARAYDNSAGFMQGMSAYLTSEYERPATNHKVLWQRGSAKLYDLAPDATDAVAILCVPSLINQSTILDLYPERSFVTYLKQQGFRPLLLDWGSPEGDELSFSTADYITGYALDALQTLREAHDGPIALLGYCMGGIFTTAMAQLAPMFVDAMVLLATPWDFSAEDTPRVLLDPATQTMLRQWMMPMNPVPPVVTQTVFHLIDPWRVQEKYSRYPNLSDAEQQHFLAVEQWVNTGVPLARRVAEECFVDWPHGNILATHQWKVGRRWIEPETIQCPTLAVIPTKDAIVPEGCAMPLTQAIKRCDVIKPETGHVSMVIGTRAKAQMWKPVVSWLQEKF